MARWRGLFDWLASDKTTPIRHEGAETVLVHGAANVEAPRVVTNVQDRLRPVRELGRGGMCAVHEAEDRQLFRHSAIKVMHPEVARSPEAHQQFVIEARITSQLEHPNIIPVYEYGEDEDGVPYINLRKVGGGTLESLIHADAGQRLHVDNLTRVVRVLIKVCEALEFAHRRGVVHRDLKPENIMAGEFGEVYVMDWGVALVVPHAIAVGTRPVEDGGDGDGEVTVAGTPIYMAPEQLSDDLDAFGPWTDVFLLGATLYHVLAGRAPHEATGGLHEILRAVRACDFTPLPREVDGHAVPPALARIVERAMASEPADRFASMGAFREALQRYLEGGGIFAEARFEAGDVIVRQGDSGQQAFVIRSGTCEVLAEEDGRARPLRNLGAGDVFGEMAILAGGRRTSTVRAVTPVVVEVLEPEMLTAGLAEHSPASRFVRALAERFIEVDRVAREAARDKPDAP